MPGLEKAKLNGVATFAARNRKAIAGWTQAYTIQFLKEQDNVLPDWKIARDYGTAAHQVLDNIIHGRSLNYDVEVPEGSATYPVINPVEWVPKWWDQFNREFAPVILGAEQTVVNDRLGYAGSFDLLLSIDGVVTVVDCKTNKAGPKPDTALQNMAYARCNSIVDMSTGVRSTWPQIAQSRVLWMRPEGWNFFPLQFDDEVWRRFFARLILFMSSQDEHQMIGDPLFDGPDSIEPRRW